MDWRRRSPDVLLARSHRQRRHPTDGQVIPGPRRLAARALAARPTTRLFPAADDYKALLTAAADAAPDTLSRIYPFLALDHPQALDNDTATAVVAAAAAAPTWADDAASIAASLPDADADADADAAPAAPASVSLPKSLATAVQVAADAAALGLDTAPALARDILDAVAHAPELDARVGDALTAQIEAVLDL